MSAPSAAAGAPWAFNLAWQPAAGSPGGRLRAWVRRQTALAVALILLPMVALSALAVSLAVGVNRDAEQARLAHAAHTAGALLDTRLQTYIAGIEALALARSVSSDNIDLAAFTISARRLQDVLGARIVLIGPGPDYPILLNSGGPPRAPQVDGPERQAFLRPFHEAVFRERRPVAIDRFLSRMNGRPTLAVDVPVVANNGTVRFALAAAFNSDSLSAILAAAPLGRDDTTVVIDGHGELIAQAGAPLAGGKLNMLRAIAASPDRNSPRMKRQFVAVTGQSSIAPQWRLVVAEPRAAFDTAAWQGLGGVSFALLAALALAAAAGGGVWLVRRRAAEEAAALRAGRAQIDTLHGGLPALVHLTRRHADGTVNVLYWGGDAKAVCGWALGELRETADWDRFKEPGTITSAALGAQAAAQGCAIADYRFRRPDGSWVWLRSTQRRLARHADGSTDLVGYIVNITAEREAVASLVAASRLNALGELAAGLAHELKQPLAVISMAAENGEAALRSGDTTAVRKKFERIAKQAQRAGGLIEHLRRFARHGETEEAAEPAALAEIVQAALDIVGGALLDAQVKLSLDLPPSLPPVQCQRLALEQVFVNLFINARDAMAARAPERPRWLRVTAVAEPGAVVVGIGDSGGGLPEAVVARLFEPFVTTKAPAQGTGLGLAICHNLLRGMDASITARNDGPGALFTLRLQTDAAERAAA